MTTLQKAIVTTAVAVLAGAGIYEARQVVRLREQNQTFQQRQAPLVEQIRQLQSERDDATNRLASLRGDNERSKSNPNQNELLKLRGEVNALRRQASEADQRAQISEQKLETALSTESQFTTHQAATINAAKTAAWPCDAPVLDGSRQSISNQSSPNDK